MNIYDIAAKAGVSVATVSRVINGSDKVRPSTKKRIEQIIEENHFSKFDTHARRKRTGTVSLITVSLTKANLSSFVQELIGELSGRGYHTILSLCRPDFQDLHANMEPILSKVDAFILLADQFHEWPQAERNYVMNIAKTVPILLVNGFIDSPGIYNIIQDAPRKMFETVDAHIKSGESNLVYIFPTMTLDNVRLLSNYNDAYALNHLEPDAANIHMCPDTESLLHYLTEYFGKILSREAEKVGHLPNRILTGDPDTEHAITHFLADAMLPKEIPVQCIGSISVGLASTVAKVITQRLNAGYAASSTVIPL